MTESTFWSSVVQPRLSLFGKVERIENMLGKGMPDVVACLREKPGALAITSFIETKHEYLWPIRDRTPVRFNHFGDEQVLWLEGWWRAGGLCCVLAQIERDYLLIPPWHAREVAAGASKAALTSMAVVRGHGVFPTGAIIKCLARPSSELIFRS